MCYFRGTLSRVHPRYPPTAHIPPSLRPSVLYAGPEVPWAWCLQIAFVFLSQSWVLSDGHLHPFKEREAQDSFWLHYVRMLVLLYLQQHNIRPSLHLSILHARSKTQGLFILRSPSLTRVLCVFPLDILTSVIWLLEGIGQMPNVYSTLDTLTSSSTLFSLPV
jgi:hypothetical protein